MCCREPETGRSKNNLDKGGAKVDEAVSHFQDAIKYYPMYGTAYINLGVTYAKNGRIEEACALWKSGRAEALRVAALLRLPREAGDRREVAPLDRGIPPRCCPLLHDVGDGCGNGNGSAA